MSVTKRKVKPDAMPSMKEAAFLALVVGTARRLGWKVYHTWRSDHSEAGFPDLVLVKGTRMLIWELKTDEGKLSPEQTVWLDALDQVETVEPGCVRPTDMDAIFRDLGGEP